MAKEAEILLEDVLGSRQTGGLPVMRRDPRFASPVEQLYKTQRAMSSFASYSPPILFSLVIVASFHRNTKAARLQAP